MVVYGALLSNTLVGNIMFIHLIRVARTINVTLNGILNHLVLMMLFL